MNQKQSKEFEEEYSLQIESEAELLNAFGEKDQKRVLTPKGVSYPIKARHYFAWVEPSRVYTYMIFKRPDWKEPIGVVFKRTYTGERIASGRICDWCLTYGSSEEVGMLSVKANSKTSFGMMLCLDLDCASRLEEVSELSGKNFEKLARQLYERISRFYESLMREKKDIALENVNGQNVQ